MITKEMANKKMLDVEALEKSIDRFFRWLKDHGYETYDPYDLWGTAYGLWARRVYYKSRLIGMPLVLPVLACDMLVPQVRRFVIKKDRHPNVDAFLALSFLNLHETSTEYAYLREAENLAISLLSMSVPGYSGHCWGYPFDWQNNRGLWKKNTPFITSVPYAFEAFLKLYDLTKKQTYLDTALSVARFASRDLKETETAPGAVAASYSPLDNTQVINTNAYRALILYEANARGGEEEFKEKADKNLEFILRSQKPDGSWLYAENNPQDAFIDHFHTCFVLKNLAKIYELNHDQRVFQALHSGYKYYREKLFDKGGEPVPFAKKPRLQIVKREMYDYAEAINLGVVMRRIIPEAYEHSLFLAEKLCRHYQLKPGYFAGRVYIGGRRGTMPYLRWPQSQLFYALTQVLKAEVNGGRNA